MLLVAGIPSMQFFACHIYFILLMRFLGHLVSYPLPSIINYRNCYFSTLIYTLHSLSGPFKAYFSLLAFKFAHLPRALGAIDIFKTLLPLILFITQKNLGKIFINLNFSCFKKLLKIRFYSHENSPASY
jgi:hypothetical protein